MLLLAILLLLWSENVPIRTDASGQARNAVDQSVSPTLSVSVTFSDLLGFIGFVVVVGFIGFREGLGFIGLRWLVGLFPRKPCKP